ncbi:DUF397 domain-containing protein [Nocardiopsis coralliicola]
MWKKSSYSTDKGQECVEVADRYRILVRDSKNTNTTLQLPYSEWVQLLAVETGKPIDG